jgi:hypothetical protein
MKTKFSWLLPLLVIGMVLGACSTKSKYDRKLKQELASGVRYDSLFMGMYFGMPQRDFYGHCWKLNKQGLIRQGPGNTTVEYVMKDELKHAATMDFYPSFVDGKIYEMPVRFTYTGWAPWNKELSVENLQKDVLHWFEKLYGTDFLEVVHPKKGSAFVKINGNRRISIYKEDNVHVMAVFTDMTVPQALIDSTRAAGKGNPNFR